LRAFQPKSAGTKARVIPIESVGIESARGASTDLRVRQWVKRNILTISVDSIAMAILVAFVPIGALIIVQTNKSFPRFLKKTRGTSVASVHLAQTLKVQGRPVVASQGYVVHKPDRTGVVSDVRYTFDSASAVVTVDLDRETQFEVHRISSPERIYLDLQNTRIAPALFGKQIQTQDRLLRALRVGEHEHQTTRITLVTAQICDYAVSRVPDSSQLRMEVRKARAEAEEDNPSRGAHK
jgi:AMIN domain